MIRVDNLVKKFGEVTAVDGVSFSVAAGEIFAFLGPNGAGKTTTIQMLTTLLRPDSGEIRIDGLDPPTGRPADRPTGRNDTIDSCPSRRIRMPGNQCLPLDQRRAKPGWG
jgi:ABC-type sugar transport system ATPase subunit